MKYSILLLIFLISTLHAVDKPSKREITKQITGKKTTYYLNKKKYFTFLKKPTGFILEIYLENKKIYSIIKINDVVNKTTYSSKYSINEVYRTSKGIPEFIFIISKNSEFFEDIIYKNNEYVPISTEKYIQKLKSNEVFKLHEDI